jgi:hypothetical protein
MRNTRGPVQHEGVISETGIQKRFLNGLEPLDVEMLFAFELVSAM